MFKKHHSTVTALITINFLIFVYERFETEVQLKFRAPNWICLQSKRIKQIILINTNSDMMHINPTP